MALSTAVISEIQSMQKQMPTPRAAMLFALRLVQADAGCVGREEIIALSELFGLPPIQVAGVARFYDLLSANPLGPDPIRVCEGVVCVMRGAQAAWDALNKRAMIERGPMIEKSACLGHCDYAPTALVDGQLMGLENSLPIFTHGDATPRGGESHDENS